MECKLIKIEDLEFYINDKTDYSKIDKKDIKIGVENQMVINSEIAYIVMSAEFCSKKDNTLLLKEKIKMTFEGDFSNYNVVYTNLTLEEKQKLEDLSIELSEHIIGTIRGIIFNKTKDHPFLSQIIMPIVRKETLKLKLDEDLTTNK